MGVWVCLRCVRNALGVGLFSHRWSLRAALPRPRCAQLEFCIKKARRGKFLCLNIFPQYMAHFPLRNIFLLLRSPPFSTQRSFLLNTENLLGEALLLWVELLRVGWVCWGVRLWRGEMGVIGRWAWCCGSALLSRALSAIVSLSFGHVRVLWIGMCGESGWCVRLACF